MSPLALSLRFLQTQSDAQLAALARAGHERAFEALVRRYRRELLAYCRRVGSVGTSAEDTLQQALLQAWSAIRTGVDVRDPRAWLYRIVHNVAVSNQRRPVLVPVEVRDTAGVSGADHVAEQRMAARDALAGLAALPDLQREVMVGTAVDGMSHEELASALGLSSGAVRGLIYRARATLRAAAAAITPGPVIAWALRTGSGGPGSGLYEALAGGGTAGLGGILVKGGAIAATAGAIATATGISASHKASHHHATRAVAAVQHRVFSHPALASAGSSRVLVADPTSSHFADPHGSAQQGSTSAGPGQAGTSDHGFAAVSGSRGPGERRHDGGAGRGSDDGSRDGSSGTGGQQSGHRGSGSGPGSSDDGSPSGGSGSPSAPLPLGSGSGGSDDGGQLSGTAGGSSGSSGGSGGGGSLSSGGSPGTASISSDGGGGGSDGGSGRDGGTTTTTTATTATTTSGGDGSGHPGGD